MAQGAICRGHECNHTLLRFKSPTWFSVYFSGLFPLPWAFPWLQSERREKSERGYECDWSTLQTEHQFTRRGDSCVCASGPLWLANEILLLDAELLLNSKASKKRGEWPPPFFLRKGDSRGRLFYLKHASSFFAFKKLKRNYWQEGSSSWKSGWR